MGVTKKTFQNLIRHLVTVEEDCISSSGKTHKRLQKYVRKVESLLATITVEENNPLKAQPSRDFPFVLADSTVTLVSDTGKEKVGIVTDLYRRNVGGMTLYYLSEAGTALIGKSLNESAEVDIGKGLKLYEIEKITVNL